MNATFANMVFAGGGILVLGQEQDSLGGQFNLLESFSGSLTALHIWDYILAPGEVLSLVNSCENKTTGNVKSWADFQTNLHGQLEITTSSFCQSKFLFVE